LGDTYSKIIFFQVVVSVCPANNRPIAEVTTGNVADYESCIVAAEEAWSPRYKTFFFI
jgi:hypothetical protein